MKYLLISDADIKSVLRMAGKQELEVESISNMLVDYGYKFGRVVEAYNIDNAESTLLSVKEARERVRP